MHQSYFQRLTFVLRQNKRILNGLVDKPKSRKTTYTNLTACFPLPFNGPKIIQIYSQIFLGLLDDAFYKPVICVRLWQYEDFSRTKERHITVHVIV